MTADMFPDTVPDARIVDGLTELKRELEMRRRVYPRWVDGGRMTQAAADRQIGRLEGVIEVLEEIKAGGRATSAVSR